MKLKKIAACIFACLSLTCVACATSGSPAPNAPQDDVQKRWETLSDQEKNQVYEIMEERAKTESALLEKYAQLGLIDEEKAEELQKHIEKRMEEMKKEGVFPGAGKGPREEGRRKTA